MRSVFRPAGVVLAAVLFVAPAAGQSTWSGGGGNGLWSNGGAAGNWSGAAAPASGATTALLFGGTSQLATNQDIANPFLLNNLTFNAGAGAFSIAGNEIRFGGASNALTQNAANAISISAPVSFDGTGTIAGAGAGTLTLSNLTVRQGNLTVSRNVTVGLLTLGVDGGTAASIDTGSNVLTLAGDVTFAALTGTVTTPAATIGGIVNLGGADRTFAGIYSSALTPFIDLTINATITGTGGFIKGGSVAEARAWMILNAANTYTGPTTLQAGAERLYLGVANALPAGTALTVANATSLFLTNTNVAAGSVGFSQSVGSLSDGGTAGGIIRLGQDSANPVLTVGSDNTSTTFAGSLIGGGSLVKVGTGTLTLSGNGTIDHTDGITVVVSTYSGGTTLNAGTLLVNGQTGTNSGTGTGPVTVNTGTTLGGNGRIAGLVTLNTGGKITGNLTLAGGVSFQAGSTFNVVLNSATNYSQLNILGPLNLNNINLNATLNYSPASGDRLFIVVKDGTDPITGTFNGLPNNATVNLGTFTAQLTYFGDSGTNALTGGNDVVFYNFTPIPEPTTVLGLAVAGLGGIRGVRRRLRRA